MVAKAVGSLKNLPTNNRCTPKTWISWEVKEYVFSSCIINEAIFDGSSFENIK